MEITETAGDRMIMWDILHLQDRVLSSVCYGEMLAFVHYCFVKNYANKHIISLHSKTPSHQYTDISNF